MPHNPPFVDWQFRDPTNGRTGRVGYERFSAAQGWAWDRHKLGGRLTAPKIQRAVSIIAVQRYYFYCERCGVDLQSPGPDAGPHSLVRVLTPKTEAGAQADNANLWRYSFRKYGVEAWMDINCRGYVADSAGIGFGPWG